MCADAGVPCIALAGSVALGPRALREAGFTAAFAVGAGPRRLPDALAETEGDLARAAAGVGRVWAAARGGA